MGAKVDTQVAAPAETRTPNWHRAKIAHKRVRMEGWRQRRPSSQEDHSTNKGNYKTDLTLTGLLMEGLGEDAMSLVSCGPMSKRGELLLILVATVGFAPVPSVVIYLTGSIALCSVTVAAWLLLAALFCWRAQTKSALWIFVLLPFVVYLPFVFIAIIFTGSSNSLLKKAVSLQL